MHYKIAVITNENQTVEEMLRPFDENLKVKRYMRYTKEQAIKQGREINENEKESFINFQKIIKEMPSSIIKKQDILDYLHKNYISEYYYNYYCNTTLDYFDKTDEELYNIVAENYKKEDIDKDGNIYAYYNENAKWDWYATGRSWENILPLKDGSKCNSAPIREIKFYDEKDKEEHEKFWDSYVIEGKEESTHYYKKYYLEKYKTKEQYVKECCSFSTSAILDSNGIWHETEQIDEYMDIIKNEDENNILTIVNCHI